MSTKFIFPCSVEPAKSSRAVCRRCKRQITKGTLRIGQQYNKDHSGQYWYHTKCFKYPTAESPEDFFFGYERLSNTHRNQIHRLFGFKLQQKDQNVVGKTTKRKKTTIKKKRPVFSSDVIMATSPQQVVAADNDRKDVAEALPELYNSGKLTPEQGKWLISCKDTQVRHLVSAAYDVFVLLGDQEDFADTLAHIHKSYNGPLLQTQK
eukprot:TRINITY_DN18634_c0_g1_i1.p1 TRINITY_DN18634_c0_g1~~TRINITY_DN18634_c0_g1_i1.p1  ORF type:complete len:207 (+),score=21.18 TRINITY_DN18634_c0_g1_i1:1-621(+)